MAFDGDDGEGGNGGGDGGLGGSADLLGGGGGGGQGGGNGGGGADDDAAGIGGAGGGGDGQDPEFYGLLSAEGGEGDNPSNRDYIKGKGFKDIDALVKSYREAERAVRDSGRVKLPGENASDDERKAFARAIGVPEAVDGYEIKGPEGVPLNEALITKLSESALKHGAPKAAFQGLVADFIQLQLDEAEAARVEQDGKAQAQLKAWGAEGNAKLAFVDKATAALGLNREDLQGIRSAIGADRALQLFARLGEGMAEDALLSGGRGRFGVTPAEAQAELTRLNNDPEHMAAIQRKDPAATARRQRLIAAVAAGKDAEAA
ncbi:hypothetical protein [Sphingobium sp. LSP13-1-1.1]|uniref:hypothetical protein n=1 Tax=Sphingobium sp. LSP13-1-1.1 TaxID=3135234 RepID=UPI00341A6561